MDKINFARHLRKNMTFAERLLWSKLRRKGLGVRFKRQEPIGRYIVDFVCHSKKLIIEVDGGQHAESGRDRRRDKELEEMGYKVLRFWNNEVIENLEGVIEEVRRHLERE